jgi:hypothetical protein
MELKDQGSGAVLACLLSLPRTDMIKTIFLAISATFLFGFNTSACAQAKGELIVKHPAKVVGGKIASIKGNVVTIVDSQGNTKTLELATVKDLAPGTKTGWCEDDCRVLSIGDKSIRVQRVIEIKR